MKKVAIIENEEYALENLLSYIHEMRPDYKVVFHTDTVRDALQWLKEGPDLDLIFMDIELNDGNCFEIFEQTDVLTPVIFTTAYDTYLSRAFEANSIDYLFKPITAANLEKALSKFEKLQIKPCGNNLQEISMMRRQSTGERILLTRGDEYFYLNMCEIAMFISEDKYVFAVTSAGRRYITGLTSLKSLSEKLDPVKFYLLSRSCIVNISAIKSVRKHFGNKLKVIIKCGDEEVVETVSTARRRDFLNWFGINLDS